MTFGFIDWEIIWQVLMRSLVENSCIEAQDRKGGAVNIPRREIDSKSSRYKLEPYDYNHQRNQTYILLLVKIDTEKNKVEQKDYWNSKSDKPSC